MGFIAENLDELQVCYTCWTSPCMGGVLVSSRPSLWVYDQLHTSVTGQSTSQLMTHLGTSIQVVKVDTEILIKLVSISIQTKTIVSFSNPLCILCLDVYL